MCIGLLVRSAVEVNGGASRVRLEFSVAATEESLHTIARCACESTGFTAHNQAKRPAKLQST